MKVIQVAEKCELVVGINVVQSFEKDKCYIMSDIFLEKLLRLYPGFVGLEIPFAEIYNKYEGQDLNNKKIMMLRHGGGGDILFMLTGASELRRIYPNMYLGAAISQQYEPIVRGSIVEKVYSMPLALDKWNEYHYHLIFEGVIESNREAKEYNSYDLFMKEMGLDITKVNPENKIPSIDIFPSEIDEVKDKISYINDSSKKIGIQIETSSPIRNYPPHNYIIIASELIKKGYKVFFFGGELQDKLATLLVQKIGVRSYNATSSSLRDSIVLASFMDCFIAPDSMFIHIAGALRIPVIGIYGPFLSELRMKYFKNAIGIDASTTCSPCFLHGHHYCPKGSPSPCFSLIKPELVIKVFEEFIENKLWRVN